MNGSDGWWMEMKNDLVISSFGLTHIPISKHIFKHAPNACHDLIIHAIHALGNMTKSTFVRFG